MQRVKKLIQESSHENLKTLKDTIATSLMPIDNKVEAIQLIDKRLFKNKVIEDSLAVSAEVNYD